MVLCVLSVSSTIFLLKFNPLTFILYLTQNGDPHKWHLCLAILIRDFSYHALLKQRSGVIMCSKNITNFPNNVTK